MLSCKDATRLMSQALDRHLSPWQRLQLRLHLLFCLGCRRFERQVDFLRQACRRFVGGK